MSNNRATGRLTAAHTPHFFRVIITWAKSNPGCLDTFFINVSPTNIKTQDILFDIKPWVFGVCATQAPGGTQGDVSSVMLNHSQIGICFFFLFFFFWKLGLQGVH